MIVRYSNGSIKLELDANGPAEEHRLKMAIMGVANLYLTYPEAEELVKAMELKLKEAREGN